MNNKKNTYFKNASTWIEKQARLRYYVYNPVRYNGLYQLSEQEIKLLVNHWIIEIQIKSRIIDED